MSEHMKRYTKPETIAVKTGVEFNLLQDDVSQVISKTGKVQLSKGNGDWYDEEDEGF